MDVNKEFKFCENSKKKFFWGGWGSGQGGGEVRLGGQGRCEQRSEVFVKIKKKIVGGGGRFGGGGFRLGGSGWM